MAEMEVEATRSRTHRARPAHDYASRSEPAPRPGLPVALSVRTLRVDTETHYGVTTTVRGGAGPLRVYLYLDGELLEAWAPAPATCEFRGVFAAGRRHALTARAIDRDGRWGGSSTILG